MVSTNFLKKALETLATALSEYSTRKNDLLARDGVIQRFEYSYELAVKTLNRMLLSTSASKNELEGMSFRQIIRLGAEKGWIADTEAWFAFREARNKTSHAYSTEVAEEVFETIPHFLKHAQSLSLKLEEVEQ